MNDGRIDVDKYLDRLFECFTVKGVTEENEGGHVVQAVAAFALDRDKAAQVLIEMCEERVRTDPKITKKTAGGIILPGN